MNLYSPNYLQKLKFAVRGYTLHSVYTYLVSITFCNCTFNREYSTNLSPVKISTYTIYYITSILSMYVTRLYYAHEKKVREKDIP